MIYGMEVIGEGDAENLTFAMCRPVRVVVNFIIRSCVQ